MTVAQTTADDNNNADGSIKLANGNGNRGRSARMAFKSSYERTIDTALRLVQRGLADTGWR